MSAFENYHSNNIYDSIVNYIENEKQNNPNLEISEMIQELMEIVGYSMKIGIYNIENKK